MKALYLTVAIWLIAVAFLAAQSPNTYPSSFSSSKYVGFVVVPTTKTTLTSNRAQVKSAWFNNVSGSAITVTLYSTNDTCSGASCTPILQSVPAGTVWYPQTSSGFVANGLAWQASAAGLQAQIVWSEQQ